ncbi:MAG: hypothetical protein ACTSX6_00150 [Candidatus Heimdallarchaeaceae archaeon]
MRINVTDMLSYEFQALCEYWKKRGDAIYIERRFNDKEGRFEYILHIRGLEIF